MKTGTHPTIGSCLAGLPRVSCCSGALLLAGLLCSVVPAIGQDLPAPPEVGMTLYDAAPDTSQGSGSEVPQLLSSDAEETNRTEGAFGEPLQTWTKPPPANVVEENLQAPTDDDYGAPRSSSNLLPLLLVGLAGALLLGVMALGFFGRGYNRRFQD